MNSINFSNSKKAAPWENRKGEDEEEEDLNMKRKDRRVKESESSAQRG